MYTTTYHLSSADELNIDILEAIKLAFRSKPITITVEEETDTTAYLLSNSANKTMLDESIAQLQNGQTVLVKFDEL